MSGIVVTGGEACPDRATHLGATTPTVRPGLNNDLGLLIGKFRREEKKWLEGIVEEARFALFGDEVGHP